MNVHDIRFKFSLKTPAIFSNIRISRIPESFDVLLIGLSSVLLFLNLLQLVGGTSQLFLAVVCSSILSGYVLLKIVNITKYFFHLEVAVLSFLLSFIFSGFSTLSLLPINENTRSITLPMLFILLGAVSLVLKRKQIRNKDNIDQFGNRISSVIIL